MATRVSIRLADAWPFQRCARATAGKGGQNVSIRLADAWPFQPRRGCGSNPRSGVSIRLADAWPFQQRDTIRRDRQTLVSIRLADAWPFQLGHHRTLYVTRWFQSALRMRGLFNGRRWFRPREWSDCFNPPCGCVAFSTPSTLELDGSQITFQSALRMRGLFNLEQRGDPIRPDVFQSALRMRGLFNFDQRICSTVRSGAFQSALRMRGLFNPAPAVLGQRAETVSIRLADAWPFQLSESGYAMPIPIRRFNPPCGCVAFSTGGTDACQLHLPRCFNPPCGCVAFSTVIVADTGREMPRFQSALRMRGLFNADPAPLAGPHRLVSIRLADAWPFQLHEWYRIVRSSSVSIRLADAWPFQLQR